MELKGYLQKKKIHRNKGVIYSFVKFKNVVQTISLNLPNVVHNIKSKSTFQHGKTIATSAAPKQLSWFWSHKSIMRSKANPE